MDGAKAKASKEAATQDIKAQNKKRQLEFRAQHGLVVAFFLLILYVLLKARHIQHGPTDCSTESFTRWESTSFSMASSFRDSSCNTDPSAPTPRSP